MGFSDFFGGLTPIDVAKHSRKMFLANKTVMVELSKTFNDLVRKNILEKDEMNNILPDRILDGFKQLDHQLALIHHAETEIVELNKRNHPGVLFDQSDKERVIHLENVIKHNTSESIGEIETILNNTGRLLFAVNQLASETRDKKIKELLKKYVDELKASKKQLDKELRFEKKSYRSVKEDTKQDIKDFRGKIKYGVTKQQKR